MPEYESGFFAEREKKLKERKAWLYEKLDSLKIQAPETNGDIAERSNTVKDNRLIMAMSETYGKELTDVEAALEKIAKGTYGRCEGCGGWIESGRLEAVPSARLCISCLKEPKCCLVRQAYRLVTSVKGQF